jgi:hypothetical protein
VDSGDVDWCFGEGQRGVELEDARLLSGTLK